MGLDFSLYKKRKNMTVDEFWNMEESIPYQQFEEEYDLAYGRKSWDLVYKLATREDIDNGGGILDPKRWEELMWDIRNVASDLDKIRKAYEHEEFALNHPDRYPEAIFTDEDKKSIAKYECWYDKTFDTGYPSLGYDWSVGYMTVFWKAKDKVREVLDDPDYEVYMSISY